MKKLLCLVIGIITMCITVGCQNKPNEEEPGQKPDPGAWAQLPITANTCSDFKEGLNIFKYENELSLVLPDFTDAACSCMYSYHCIINSETKEELNDFKVGYPEFVFENFEDENIVKIYGESYFIFGTTEYVLENPVFQLSEKVEESVKTYKAVCGDTTLLTVNIELSGKADESYCGAVLQQVKSSLTVL